MADNLPQQRQNNPVGNPLGAFMELPVPRQVGLLAGIAMVIALAVSVAVWGLRPSYQVLLPGMAERDVVQAMNVLGRNGIPHRLHNGTGALMVPATRAHEARLQLATEGLPSAEGVGFELLDEDNGIGTSRLTESTRYQRALEGELARSVMTLSSVESARVHLALPRQSVFLRERTRPGASVLVNLRSGRDLDETQVAGIVHLVASSVPELETERVTVVDQRGRLLSQSNSSEGALPARQLDYTRRIEEALRERVEDILAPLVGEQGMRVQVTAEVDFTQVESTREVYDPDSAVVRSEQLSEEERTGGNALGGVPGALANQPPEGAVVQAQGALEAEEGQAGAAPVNRNRRSVRNFEVDRTISHIRQAPASLSRLSVAVVVDHREAAGEAGERLRVPRDAAEMDYLTTLVRETVGFNEERGDRVNVVNASFREIEAPEPAAAPVLWEEPWVQELARQALAGLALLLIVLGVLRPALKALVKPPLARARPAVLAAPDGSVIGDESTARPTAPARTLESDLDNARQLTRDDPRLVAQVVRQWVQSDEK